MMDSQRVSTVAVYSGTNSIYSSSDTKRRLTAVEVVAAAVTVSSILCVTAAAAVVVAYTLITSIAPVQQWHVQ